MKGKRVRNIQAERFDRTTGTLLSGRYNDMSEGTKIREILKSNTLMTPAMMQPERLGGLERKNHNYLASYDPVFHENFWMKSTIRCLETGVIKIMRIMEMNQHLQCWFFELLCF